MVFNISILDIENITLFKKLGKKEVSKRKLMIDFFLTIMKLKDRVRTGWELHGIKDPESVADHTFGTVFLTYLFSEDKYDTEKCLKLALIHDIHEAIIGDLPSSEISKKVKREKEQKAFKELISGFEVKKEETNKLWREYFQRKSREAKFVRDMDKIEMIVQALFYAQKYRKHQKEIDTLQLENFFQSAKKEISTPLGKKIYQKVEQKFEEVKSYK